MPRKKRAESVVPIVAPFQPLVMPGWDAAPKLATPAEVTEAHGIDERTLRNWVGRGCPQAVGGARPRYELAKVFAWSAYYAHLQRRQQTYRTPVPLKIAYEDAKNWIIQREYELSPASWNRYVCVPLEWNHPARAHLLRVACEGAPPAPFDDEAA
jgi:hypothetical protein